MSQSSALTTVPAAVKGLNAYDAIGAMPEGFAIVLRNLFAQPYGCQLRKGYVIHQEVVGLPETLMAHNKVSPKLYAAIGTKIFDVTVLNAVPIEVTGLTITNDRWFRRMLASCEVRSPAPPR